MAKTSKGLVFALIVIIGLSFLIFAFVEQTSAQIQVSNVSPFCNSTYLVQNNTNTNKVSARNCITGQIDFTSNNSTSLFVSIKNSNACTGNGINCVIYVTSGIYSLSGTGLVFSAKSILFQCAGWSTKFITTGNFTGSVFTFNGRGSSMRDCFINASAQPRFATYNGIVIGGSNSTLTGNFIENADHGGINVLTKTTVQWTIGPNNYIANDSDDGIVIGGATNGTVIGNTIQTTYNHNCISLVSANYTSVLNNQCFDAGHGTGSSVGIALENLGAGSCWGDLIEGNNIHHPNLDGIRIYAQSGGIDSADNTTITGNSIIAPVKAGINLLSGSRILVTSNQVIRAGEDGIHSQSSLQTDDVIDANLIDTPTNHGIDFASFARLAIVGNNIFSISTGNNGIFLRGTGTVFTISNNVIKTLSTNSYDIEISGTNSNGTISSNMLIGVGKTTNAGVQLNGLEQFITITNNFVTGTARGLYEIASGTNFPNHNLFQGNDLATSVNVPITFISNTTQIYNNLGFNSKGVITNFIYSGGAGGQDGNYISPIGTTSIIAASTTYTITTSPVLILVQAIGLSTISINGGGAITPTIGETYYLYPGQTINFGAFGVTPPTLQVIFS